MPAAPHLIEVALPLPLFRTFTYAAPHKWRDRLVTGARIVVPFRGGKEVGICVGAANGLPIGREAKAVLEVPDEPPALSAPMVALCKWVAEYYVVPLGVALRSALPAILTGAANPTPSQKTRRVAQIASDLPSLLRRDHVFSRATQQRALYELLETLGGRSPVEHLLGRLDFSPSVLKGLVARGLVTITAEVVERDPFAHRVASPDRHTPTESQQHAIDALVGAGPGRPFLLHGITGSGKTLVYVELLRHIVEDLGKSAIVLVPEIALTPQTVDRFRAVFSDRVAVLHSGLSDGERYDAWLSLKRGEKRVAVGARSAVFAPLSNLGAIVVDEEHEGSYKQGETPRYHAREVAIVRARLEGAAVVLGSATPSLETWTNAASGKYRLLTLPNRVGGARLPIIEVVDIRTVRRQRLVGRANGTEALESSALVLTDVLASAIADCLGRKEQSILLLNRRGYASFVQCGDCGDVATCPDCTISLTYHRAPERLVCHYCLHREHVRDRCSRCGGHTLKERGIGTQQVERIVADRFPTARIARMDVDTTSGKWAHATILDRVARREVDILLGTQMIAKGLDFPNVTLVGVINADVGINLPDFRASERSFQLLSQVAGRAGRGPKGGRVLIQTRVPQHHAVRHAVAHDYAAFVREEAGAREQPPYPPTTRITNLVISGTEERSVARCAQEASAWLNRLLAARRTAGAQQFTLVSPAPCPVERIKTRWRWHALLKGENVAETTRVLQYFANRFPVAKTRGLRIAIDRDPVALL
ncbi:MAG: primosomal protein N' [Gemmatimonadaceae bacterium]